MLEKTVIIGGGMGPLAGVEFHKRLIQLTAGDGSDQDHLDVIHVSRSADIANRIDFLTGTSERQPAEGMVRSIAMAAAGISAANGDAVIAIPCNTFHTPAIFDPFVELLRAADIHYEIVHIIDELIDHLLGLKRVTRIGLISTVMARKHRLFHDKLEAQGLIPVNVSKDDHEAVQSSIWKIKETNTLSPEAIALFLHCVDTLADQGAQVVVVGCTELSMMCGDGRETRVPLIDPMDLLAHATIRKAGRTSSW